MVKKITYSEIGEELNIGTAYLQASNALDVAASLAEQNRDIAGMIEVAKVYIALGEMLGKPSDEDEDIKDFEFGFQNEPAVSTEIIPPDETHLEEEDEEDGLSDRVQSQLEVKLGKLRNDGYSRRHYA